MSVVRQDAKGIYIITNGAIHRPGPVSGYAHAYNMGDGDLKKGNHVKIRAIGGSPLAKITLADGGVRYWHVTGPSPELSTLRLRSAGGFKVQARMCATCIYKPDSPLDLKLLEDQVRDAHGGFVNHRTCHHSDDVCCRGFWEAHKDKFPAGQIAQRLNMVNFVDVDTLAEGK